MVWGWHEAPRQRVTSNVLARLMSPGRFPRRVTLIYRPFSSAHAAHHLEDQVNAAWFHEAVRKQQGRNRTARDRADRAPAVAAAHKEATGSGLVRVSMYACVTVEDPNDLATAVAEVEARAGQSKIKLRRLAGSQLAGFSATLPAGLHPANLARRGHRSRNSAATGADLVKRSKRRGKIRAVRDDVLRDEPLDPTGPMDPRPGGTGLGLAPAPGAGRTSTRYSMAPEYQGTTSTGVRVCTPSWPVPGAPPHRGPHRPPHALGPRW